MTFKWHQSKVLDLNQKNNMDAWRQRLLSENKSQKTATDKRIEELQALLDSKNSYFELFKTDMAKTKKTEETAKKEATTFGYDKVYAHYDEKIAGSTLYEHRKVANKMKRGGSTRGDLHSVVQSSQTIGWREPYDNFRHHNNRTGICARTFKDMGHL